MGLEHGKIGDRIAVVLDGRLYVNCPDTGMHDSHWVGDDQLVVAVYRPAVPTLHLFGGPLREACAESAYELPETEGEEDVMLVYAWFQATKYHRSSGGKITVRPGQASSSVFCSLSGISFRIKNTKADPSIVPAKGNSSPVVLVTIPIAPGAPS